MGLDGISVNQLANIFNERLGQCNIDKIQQPDRYDLLITFHAQGGPRLLLSANPAFPVAFIGKQRRDNPAQAPMFCMLLRKHLGGARLLSVECENYERALRFRFRKRDEMEDVCERSLVVELMGRYSNIILLDQNDIILDAIVHVGADHSRYREVLPARPYLPPPPQNKPVPEARLRELRENDACWLAQHLPDKPLGKALLDLCLGLSPQLAAEIIWRGALDDKKRPGELDEAEAKRLQDAATGLLGEITTAKGGGFFYPEGNKGRGDFHCLELDSMGPHQRLYSLNEAIDRVYTLYQQSDRLRQKRASLADRVNRALSKKRKLWEAYQDDLKAAENYDEKRLQGELLLSQLYQLPERVPEEGFVEVIDYYDPDQRTLRIELDPRYSVSQNANRLFKRYNKDRHTFAYAEEKARDTALEINYLESLLVLLEHAENLEALATVGEEIGSALKDRKNIKETPDAKGRKNRREKRRDEHRALPPRRYRSSDGLTILAGRNNYQNDNLSFRTARPEDIWLHAKNRPGSHVILRIEDGHLPDQSLIEAAEIAAWLSRGAGEKQQGEADMEIDYCPVSHLRKPRGAKPGFVTYENYYTVRVTAKPHDELAEDENEAPHD